LYKKSTSAQFEQSVHRIQLLSRVQNESVTAATKRV